jgi:DNA-binding transcriptional MocR family regulator
MPGPVRTASPGAGCRGTGQLRVRRDTLAAALRAHTPDWSWTLPAGGLTMWVQLPEGSDSGALAQAALRLGVAVIPGRLLSATGSGRGRVRIAYSQPPGRLAAAAPLLAQAWQASRPQAAARKRAG